MAAKQNVEQDFGEANMRLLNENFGAVFLFENNS